MISFIVPAHNEERFLGATLASIATSLQTVGEAYEVIVAADACSDATESIALDRGATLVRVDHRNIAATRNSGASAARGEILFFVDADTLANADVVSACLAAIRGGAAGGGCIFRFDRQMPLWLRLILPPCNLAGRMLKLAGGCFLFSTREAFDRIGGFDVTTYAAEEVGFLRAMRRIGRVSIPKPTVITSGRKLPLLSPWEVLRILGLIAVRGPRSFRSREGLDIFYGARSAMARGDSPRTPGS